MEIQEIETLKKEKGAVVLAHYYVNESVQRAADYVGDSFYLAQTAKKLENRVIVIAGVYFMAESVKILNPDKKVLMVDGEADCPMAHMVSIEKIKEVRETYEDTAVVTYINSSAKIKAYSDICVTSSNAVNIVKQLKNKNIFFIPDKNLGSYVAERVAEKNIVLNDGYCPIHNRIEKNSVLALKQSHPNAKVMVHPECVREVVKMADYMGSTKGIIEEVGKIKEKEFIIVTEGRMYRNTTGFSHIKGDGVAAAIKHNVRLRDLSYIQVHPTSLYEDRRGRRFLISEPIFLLLKN